MFEARIESKFTVLDRDKDQAFEVDAAEHLRRAKEKLGPYVRQTASALSCQGDEYVHVTVWQPAASAPL